MRKSTTDPVSGMDVSNTQDAPFIIEGEGGNALIIYFESQENKRAFIEMSSEAEQDFSVALYNEIKDNETMGTIN